MKHKSLTKQWWLLALMSTAAGHLYGLTTWNNNAAIAANVIDDNLQIIGTNQIINNIAIEALTKDILVTVPSGAATVRSEDTGAPNGRALYLYAAADHTITFSLMNDLKFTGSSVDLLITFSGAGNLVFMIEGGHTLTFGSDSGRQPAVFAVNMDQFTHAPTVRSVVFKRFPVGALPDSNATATVQLINGGQIIYVSNNGAATADTATIGWDASTNGTGRLELSIGNGSGVLVSGRHISTLLNPTITSISLTTPAGGRANFEVFNGQSGAGAYSGLVIANNNYVLPSLSANPWCQLNVTPTIDGFIVDQFGRITIADQSYVDYIGTATNITPAPTIPSNILNGLPVSMVIKDRNPSALFIDGSQTSTQRAQFVFEGNSAFYFRSGVDDKGNVSPTAYDPLTQSVVLSYTITPANQTTGLRGAGQIVLDVEGELDVIAADSTAGKVMNILSWHVQPQGGSVLISESSTKFPLRTFEKDAQGNYLQYNAAAFLINSRMNLYGVDLQHTDELHQLYEKNFPELEALYLGNVPEQSAPTYIGGESWKLCGGRSRPTIAFYNADLLLHTGAALSGVDLKIPDYSAEPSGIYHPTSTTSNQVNFIFYSNGRCVDQGTGRSLVLGSIIGSLASDLNTIVNPDAHLDVMQEVGHTTNPQILFLSTGINNTKVTPGISGTITAQTGVNTVYLGNASNISIGTNGATGTNIITGLPFTLNSFPTLSINGNYFSFETQGGTLRQPEAAMVTGEGGIFVDTNGIFTVFPAPNNNIFVNIATTVVKSRNGNINLPKAQVFFNSRIGIANWALNLSDATQRVLVNFGQSLSKYTLDWKYITKDFCGNNDVFIPYQFADIEPCSAPAVTDANLTGLPTIHGIVDQMQIRNSRLGDPVHLSIDAGQVRELLFLERSDSSSSITGNTTADEAGVAPIGVIVLHDDAILGLGTAHRNLDSTRAEVVLGLNGVTLIANGTGQVVLNEDTLINNIGSILTGTQFGVGGQQTLLITAPTPKELRIKSESVLDLSQFTNENQVLAIGGNVKMVVEPGARIILGGGILRFAEQSQLIFDPFFEPDFNALHTVADTNAFRSIISGSGKLLMSENSTMQIFRGAYVGLETLENDYCSLSTTMTWELQDNARILIGDEANFGGVLQIGDVALNTDASIDFTLILNGQNTLLNVNSQGLFGLNVGIISKPDTAPNNWTVNTLFNVKNIKINLIQGTFKHNQIVTGSDSLASLLAIGDGPLYTFNFDAVNAEVLGGGNIVYIAHSADPITPTVLSTVINTADFGASIISTQPMLSDNIDKGAQPASFTAQQLFDYLKMSPFANQAPNKFAALFQSSLGRSTVGWINDTDIRRDVVGGIIGANGGYVAPTNSLAIGTVGLFLNLDNEPVVFEVNVG